MKSIGVYRDDLLSDKICEMRFLDNRHPFV